MKSLIKSPTAHPAVTLNIPRIRAAVDAALVATENARQKCLVAGQMLNEVQSHLPHGEFQHWIEKHLHHVPYVTAARWARAAGNILKALPEVTIEVESEAISVSEILSTPDDELSAAARKYKQSWFDFTGKKTIKECLNGVFVDGDEAHRVDRAVNGMTKGGVGKQTDRKDWPLFVAVKLSDIGAHLRHHGRMSAVQKSELEQILRAAILGDDLRLSRGQKGRLFRFATWPDELCEVMLETLKERLKQTRKS